MVKEFGPLTHEFQRAAPPDQDVKSIEKFNKNNEIK